MSDRLHHLDAWRSTPYDAVIVGGGPAGLSAALVLGRARKRVLVVDDERPANAVSQGVGGLLGHDRVKPADLRDSGRRQLEEHAERRVPSRRRRGRRADRGPVRRAIDGRTAGARPCARAGPRAALRPAALPGIEALWGRSVFHCAFCDGWEVRDRPVAFHGSGPRAVRSALVLAGWTDDVVLCTDGAPDPGGPLLAAAGVRVRTEPIVRLAGNDGRLTQIEFSHGPAEPREALFVNTRRDQPNRLAAALGCELTAAGTLLTDADGRTNIAGVYAAGDAATSAFALGGERDRDRVARRVRGRARAPRAGRRSCRRLTAGVTAARMCRVRELAFIRSGRLAWRDRDAPVLRDPGDAIVRPFIAARCDGDTLPIHRPVSRLMQAGIAVRAIDPVVGCICGRVPFKGPFAIGHECVAQVLAVGSGVQQRPCRSDGRRAVGGLLRHLRTVPTRPDVQVRHDDQPPRWPRTVSARRAVRGEAWWPTRCASHSPTTCSWQSRPMSRPCGLRPPATTSPTRGAASSRRCATAREARCWSSGAEPRASASTPRASRLRTAPQSCTTSTTTPCVAGSPRRSARTRSRTRAAPPAHHDAPL